MSEDTVSQIDYKKAADRAKKAVARRDAKIKALTDELKAEKDKAERLELEVWGYKSTGRKWEQKAKELNEKLRELENVEPKLADSIVFKEQSVYVDGVQLPFIITNEVSVKAVEGSKELTEDAKPLYVVSVDILTENYEVHGEPRIELSMKYK